MDCVFCKISNKEIPARIITDTKNSIAFLDAFPLSPGHTLVRSEEHTSELQSQ